MPNGFAGVGCVLPLTVIANAFVELSMNWLLWQVSSEVPEIAVSGVVGTVKLAVYTAVPLTIRALDIKPIKKSAPKRLAPIYEAELV
jgi:hypothetical protein